MVDLAGQGNSFEGALKPSAVEIDSYEKDMFAQRHIQIETNQQGMWEYDVNNNVIYAGYAARGLAISANGWLLHKFGYTGNNITSRQIAYDSWTNRAGAQYA